MVGEAEPAGRAEGEGSARFSFVCQCCVTVSSEIDTVYPLGKLFKPVGKIVTTTKEVPETDQCRQCKLSVHL